MKKNKLYILILSLAAIAGMIWNTLSEPGIKELKSNFKEEAFIRNEQNTGPVIRIYSVSMDNENRNEIELYGNYMPHNKYGTTRVYFFLNSKPFPESLKSGDINIQDEFKENCIALYEKNGMSQSSIRWYPFRNEHE
jgi:hypothetical protein